jgi:hypothetical protein
MKRLILVSALLIASCGYDGKYRYKCQDPENWGKSECKPPICEVDGACTKTLLGWDPNETSVDTISPEVTTAP